MITGDSNSLMVTVTVQKKKGSQCITDVNVNYRPALANKKKKRANLCNLMAVSSFI
jgi:hypothetical protein